MRRPPRRLVRALALLAGIAVVLGVPLALRSRWETHHTRLATLELTSPHVTGRPLRVLQVTDVHDMPRQEQRDAVVAIAREQHPDLVALTGDLTSYNTRDLTRMDGFVGDLAAVGAPVFYVPGNHENDNDHPGATVTDVVAMVQRHGVTALVNRHTRLDGAWGHLDVIGTDDYYTHHGDLPAAMAGTRPDAYHLVLSHAPVPAFADALSASDADLAISGHTHGGQVRIPGVGALYTPGGGFPPRHDKGLFDVGTAQLYVDSGVGQSGGPRLNDQSQVTLITVTGR